MAITLVGQAGVAGSQEAGSPVAVTYSSTAGHTLIVTCHFYDNNSGMFVAPTGVTDSAGNYWHVSTTAAQAQFIAQTPPTASAADTTDGASAHGADFVAWCVGAAHVTSVTVAWTTGIQTYTRLALSEWSGIVQFDNSWAGGSATAASSVTATLNLSVTGELVIGSAVIAGSGTESLPASWTGLTSGGGGNAYRLMATVGSYSPAWTSTIAGSWTGAAAVFSPQVLPTGARPQAVSVRLPQHQSQSQQVYQPGLIYVN